MTPDSFLALVGLAATAAFTPGPNNALVTASGANFGFRATFPHVLGIALGFPVMIFLIAIGLGEIVARIATLALAMKVTGVALLLWIGWKVATAGTGPTQARAFRPFTFLEAAGFQWINPKGWAMALAITAQFVNGDGAIGTATIVATVFAMVGLLSASAWAAFGTVMQRLLRTEGRERWFNRVTGALIASFALILALGTA